MIVGAVGSALCEVTGAGCVAVFVVGRPSEGRGSEGWGFSLVPERERTASACERSFGSILLWSRGVFLGQTMALANQSSDSITCFAGPVFWVTLFVHEKSPAFLPGMGTCGVHFCEPLFQVVGVKGPLKTHA